MFHHDSQEFDDDFGAWSDQNLTFTTFLSIVDWVKSIGENIHANHFGAWELWSNTIWVNILKNIWIRKNVDSK